MQLWRMAAWSVREAALDNGRSFWKEPTEGGRKDQEGCLEKRGKFRVFRER
jgi:hypothetical protein